MERSRRESPFLAQVFLPEGFIKGFASGIFSL
jgi:hypothetical protein